MNKVKMGVALAIMATMPTYNAPHPNTHDSYWKKENWQGRGKRPKPKSR